MFIVYSTLGQVEFLASWFLKVNSKEYKRHKKLTPYNGSFKFAVFFSWTMMNVRIMREVRF